MAKERLDRSGPHRATFEKNKKIILKTQNVCGICGKPVDLSLKAPNPLAPCIDHIIPVSRGGFTVLDNLQVLCEKCNLQKSNMTMEEFKLWRNKHGTTK